MNHSANFPRDPDPDCHIFQRPVRRSKNSLLKVFYACSSQHVFKHNIFLRGEEVIIHGYVQDELLLDFLLSLELFFLLFHRFIHVNV